MCFDKLGIYDDNFIILDTETTGLRRTDEVIELGIISSNGEVLYESLFNPDFDIDSKIMKITGIRNGDLYDAPYFEDEWDEIKRIIRGKTIIGYNVSFDIRMLEQTMSKYNIIDDLKDIYDSSIDARKIVMNLCDFDSYKQEDVAKSLGVYNHQAHRAANDCLTLLDILIKLNKISNLELKQAESKMSEVIKRKDSVYRKEVKRKSKRDTILSMLEEECTIKEIADELGCLQETVEDNIIRYIENGEMDYELVLPSKIEDTILNAIDEMGGYTGNIYAIKGYLNDSVSALNIKLTVHKHKELEMVEENNVEEKLSLTILAKKNNINRDDLKDFLINNGFISDIRTITDKGIKYGIEYMHGDNGAQWPIYGSKIQEVLDSEMFENDYSPTDFNKNRKVKPLSRLSGYKNFKHAASAYYFNDIQRYADLSKKQIKDYIKVFRLEDCKTTEEDFELIKKTVLAEMNGLITRDEKYVLFGSKSEYFNVSKEDLRRVERIVKNISL